MKTNENFKCPYCNSSNIYSYVWIPNLPFTIHPTINKDSVISKDFEAMCCKECCLGFSRNKLSVKETNYIYNNYIYIQPSNNIGSSKYIKYIKLITKHLNIDDNIVEIGSSDGYILNELNKRGYRNLTGVEPSKLANIAISNGLNIKNEYFNEALFFDETIDSFLLMHVYEHFIDPFDILKTMVKKLKNNGKIIIEVPNFTGYHHEHLFYYNSNFVHRLSNDFSLSINELIIDSDVLQFVLVKTTEVKPYTDILESKEDILNKINKLLLVQDDNFNKLLDFLPKEKEKEKVYWWGSGSLSIFYISKLSSLKQFKYLELMILDGDKNKVGLFVPPINKAIISFEEIKNSKIKYLIIASSFFNEIQETIKDIGTTVEYIYILDESI